MKKKIALVLLPVLMLASCTNAKGEVINPFVVSYQGNVPAIRASGDGSFVTYLMMSKYGRITVDGTTLTGQTVEEKFLENCIIWETAPGADLPDASQVSSTVDGATFRGWAQYNDNVYPDYLTKVPEASGRCVYAIFDGTNAGGGGGGQGEGGGGGDTPTPGTKVTYSIVDMPEWVTNDGCVIFTWAWGGNAGAGAWYSLTYTSATSATFECFSDIDGFLLARCVNGTVTPDWSITSGSAVGRIFNQTNNINVTKGVTTYSCASWFEYPRM